MTVREALQQIYDDHGRLTPKLVLDEARDPGHPLHSKVFDVDVPEAAERYYLESAHRLIQSVKIKYTQPTGQLIEIRAFQAVRSANTVVYEPSEKVATDPILRELTLRQMKADWEELKSRYASFEEFSLLVQGDLAATG